MASGTASSTNADDFRHFCSLCMESYSGGRIPKLLPCYHSFCLQCLVALVRSTNAGEIQTEDNKDQEGNLPQNEMSETHEDKPLDTGPASDIKSEDEDKAAPTEVDKKSPETFLCPTCRALVAIPPGGVLTLQTNFYLTTEKPSTESSSPVLCEMCEVGHQQEAQHFCHHCQQHMCRGCRRLHDLVVGARDHHVETLADRNKPESSIKEKKTCQFHPDQVLCFHCCKCDVAICLHCKLTSHEGHETQDMATAAILAKGELTGLQTQANKQLRALEACIARLERDELNLKRQKLEVVQQVESRFDLLMSRTTRARDELLEELAAKEEIMLNDIHAKKTLALISKGNISSRLARASHTVSLDADVVLMKNELQAALLTDDSFKEFQILADRKGHITFFTCSAETSILELDTLRAFVGKLIEASGGDDEGTSMSFRELVTAVSKMNTDIQGLKVTVSSSSLPKVSFHTRSTNGTSVNYDQTLIFNDVLSNAGNGYSSSTGIFTAPEPGTYYFTTTVKNNNDGQYCDVCLYVDGTEWGKTDSPDSCTCHCIVPLKKGQKVFVRIGQQVLNMMGYQQFTLRPNSCMFSGALIHE